MAQRSLIRRSLLAAVAAVACVIPASAEACTWFRFVNDQRHAFVGRTMEWPGDLQGAIARIPRGHNFGAFRNQYGFVGMSHLGTFFSDGLNEHGLAASALWLGESKFSPKTKTSIPVTDLMPMVLGTARSVDEALALIRSKSFHGVTAAVGPGIQFAAHYSITDPSGRSVVVEFLNGKTVITENKVGALTNDPDYQEQLKTWSTFDVTKIDEGSFLAFDYSPQGRFSRMAAFNATQPKVPDSAAAVNRAWSIVDTVDIPQGTLYWRWVSDEPQFTSYSVVVDLQDRVYYFRTYNNYNIRKVSLDEINFATTSYKVDTIFTPPNYQEFSFS